ncbi:MAG TPA: alpha/beta family hydrolase [Actinomycetota bacterium]
MPEGARGLVVFAHGSGSSRHSPRNQQVAGALQPRALGTLLFDLLTPEEDEVDRGTASLRFDIPLLAERVEGAVAWVREEVPGLPVGLFGASTGAAAALVAAEHVPDDVRAVVSRGGRPDLAGDSLPQVVVPTLLIVGSLDTEVLGMNRDAMARMERADVALEVVEGASHLFEEPGKLELVGELARDWFAAHLS